MSKGSIFWGKSRGKLGEMVLAVVKGQQTQRAYNGTPANPRTELQQVQRIKFAAAVKFYKSSVQNMFKMAFEGKKQTESDYNAFMRTNLKEGIAIFPTKEEVDDPYFPMVAPWRVSQGSLNPVGGISFQPYDPDLVQAFADINPGSLGSTYDWSEFYANNPSFQAGDILTFATMMQQVSFTGTNVVTLQKQPVWVINSIIIGADLRGADMAEYFSLNKMSTDNNKLCHQIDVEDYYDGMSDWKDQLAVGSVCIHTRPRSGGLQVSSEYIHLNDLAQQVFEFLSDDGNRALGTWNAEQLAILQGSQEKPSEGGNWHGTKATNLTIAGSQTATAVSGISPSMKKGDSVQLSISIGGTAHNFKAVTAGELLPSVETFTISGTQYKMAVRVDVTSGRIDLSNVSTATTGAINVTALKINGNNVTLA